MKLRILPIVGALLCTAQNPNVVSPSQGSVERDAPLFRIRTQVVTVDLVATDGSGRSITDLKLEDIRVVEDGAVRPIKSMEREQVGGKAKELAELKRNVQDVVSKLPKDVSTNLTILQHVPTNTASTVLVLDAMNTPWASRASSRQKMLKLLQTLAPDQPVAVYGLSGSLHLLQDFTTDPAHLREAVNKSAKYDLVAGGRQDKIIDNTASDMVATSLKSDAIYANLRAFEAEESATLQEGRMQRTLAAMNEIAHRLEQVPGRKNLVWVSSAFPLTMWPDALGVKDGPQGLHAAGTNQEAHDFSNLLQQLAANLERARIAVYPVDADQLSNASHLTASDATPGSMLRYGVANGAVVSTLIAQEAERDASRHDAMNMVAEMTGGRAYYNRNDLDGAVREAMQDGGAYYALTFSPAREDADGRFHTIKLTTTRKGVQLRYRHGYYALAPGLPDKNRARVLQQELYDALVVTEEPSTGVLLFARKKKDADVIDLVINAPSLTFAQGDDGKLHNRFELSVAAFDEKGKLLSSSSQTVQVGFKPEQMASAVQEGIRYPAPIPANGKAQRVRVAVRDLASDRLGTVDVPLQQSSRAITKTGEAKSR
jgi:VWFA-related protein